MKVLVTGGLGYLGGRLAQALAGTIDCELTLATRRIAWPQPQVPSTRIVTVDWTSNVELERICEGMNAVVHLAGMNAADCASHPVAALEFNGAATARLVRAAAAQRVARFVRVSTVHVYGAALKGSVDELTCPLPRHSYATSHRAGEDAVRLARDASGIDGIVARLSNVFGAPADSGVDCWSLVTNDLCRQAVTTGRAVLRSAGIQRRDFVPMSEACRAIAHLLTVPVSRLGDGLFNLGSGWAPTVFEMAELVAARVAAVLGRCPQVVTGCVADDGGEPFEYCVAKLAATGFDMRREAIVDELDRLVAFCALRSGPPLI